MFFFFLFLSKTRLKLVKKEKGRSIGKEGAMKNVGQITTPMRKRLKNMRISAKRSIKCRY